MMSQANPASGEIFIVDDDPTVREALSTVMNLQGYRATAFADGGTFLAAAMARHFPGQELLTPREREVLGQIAGGASNKEAGRHLGISPRTIEVHRARIMEKLGAKNAADLVRIVLSEGRRA